MQVEAPEHYLQVSSHSWMRVLTYAVIGVVVGPLWTGGETLTLIHKELRVGSSGVAGTALGSIVIAGRTLKWAC